MSGVIKTVAQCGRFEQYLWLDGALLPLSLMLSLKDEGKSVLSEVRVAVRME